MRGHLKSLILKLLDKKPMSGSQIISELEINMNWKPSCGSIYPLLNNMEQEKLTKHVLEKNKKKYYLTNNGKKILKEKQKQKEQLIKSLENSYRLLESVYDVDVSLELEMLEDFKKEEMPFHEIYDELNMVKQEMIRIKKENKLMNNLKKIKQILKKTSKELKKI